MSVPVLVLDDEELHFTQMEQCLGHCGYSLTHIKEQNSERVADYKAKHRDNQIVIVDLNLSGKQEFDWKEGIEFIREALWPVDRNTVFIVFSQYINDRGPVPQVIGRVEPRWVLLPKTVEVVDGVRKLSADCLKRLRSIVDDCKRTITPSLALPQYDALPHVRAIQEFLVIQEYARQSHGVIERCITRSVSLLNALAISSSQFSRAGFDSIDYCLGVYGSCGRLEAREESDVEVSVFVQSAAGLDADSRQTRYATLAASFWNRIYAQCGELGRPCVSVI